MASLKEGLQAAQLTRVLLGIRDKDGNLWTVAGYLAAAQPVHSQAGPLALPDMEDLQPVITGMRILLDGEGV